MKTLKRVISALMAFVLLCTMLPVQAFAAEEEAVAELRFYSDCTIDAYTVVSVGKDHKLTFNLGKNPYKFAAKFDNPEEIGHVFVSSTVEGKTRKLKAEYNEKTGMFETNGYFDPENKYYEPCNVRVEYAPKASAPAVGSEVDWNALMEHIGADLQGSTVTNTNEDGSSYGQLELAGELAGVTLDYLVEELEPEALSELRKEYNSQSGLAAYIVPGLDDEKYYAYLDMSDPSTYIMFLDDGLDVGSKAVSLKLDMMEQGVGDYSKLSEISQGISNVSTVVGFVGDAYNIHKDMDALRDELDTIDYHDPDEKQAALDAVTALEADQIAFALLITALPIIATGGGASPAAAALFTGIIGVMSAASDTVYGLRVGGIKDKAAKAEWTSNTAGGQCTDTITWEYDKATRTAVISGTGPMPNYGFNVIAHTPWYDVWGEDGRLPVERIIIGEGITYIGSCTFWDNYKDTTINYISIPDTVEKIGVAAFFRCNNLSEISLPEGVTSVANDAFVECGMESVRLPLSLTSLGYPFYYCSDLTDVYYAGNVSQWESISGWQNVDPFMESEEYDTSKSYTLHMHPSGTQGQNCTWYFSEDGTLTIYGEGDMGDIPRYKPYATAEDEPRQPWKRFRKKIEKVELAEGITSISSAVFTEHSALREIKFPSTLTAIGFRAFQNCTSLKEITIPESVSSSSSDFYGCSSLEKIVVKGSVNYVDIEDCAALTTIEYPDTVKSIKIYNCDSLKNVVIPYGVTEIDIFENCPSLESVTIPATVTDVIFHENMLAGSTALKDIYYGSSETTWEEEIAPSVDPEVLANATVHFTSEGLYGHNLFWDFDEATGLLKIWGQGDMVNFVWHRQPWYCYASQIKQVIVDEGVTSIGQNAFGFTEEGDAAYTNLSSIQLPKTLLKIGDGAFAACPALPSIEIPNGVTRIGSEAFMDNSVLTSIELPDSVESLEEAAFKNCTALETVVLHEGLKTIGYEAFYNCTALTGIEIPDSVTELGGSAFYNCAALEEVKVSANLQRISSETFCSCVALKEITIPATITDIGGQAFGSCMSLKRILFQGDAPAMSTGGWNGGTFQGVTADAYYPVGNASWTEDKLQDYGGNLMWHTDDNMDESGLTEKYIQDQIDAGYKNVSVDGIIKLQNNFSIPKGITVSVSSASTLVIPDGKTLTVQAGKLSAWQGGAWGESKIIVEKGGTLEVITDESNNGDLGVLNPGNYLIVEEGGLLKVNGTVSAHYGATIDMQGSYEIGTDKNGKPWHIKIGYADTEKGYVPSVIKGIPLKDQMLVWNVTTTQQWEELVEVLNEDAYGSYDIPIQTPVTLDQELIVPKLCSISGINETNYMEITESGILRSYGEVITYSDNALKNNGTIEIYNRLYIAGAMPNAGTIHVNAGGLLDIRNGGYVTNTGTVHINESGKVEVGREGTFQNDGEVYVNAGGSLEIVNTDWAQGTWLGKDAVINGGSIGHTHSYSQSVHAPTCTEVGYTLHYCSCGEAYTSDYVDALGHDYDEGKVTHEPTESDEGAKTFTCQTCGETKTESIPKLDHVHKYEQKVTAPTCTQQGYPTYTCECGDSYVDTYTDPTGHSFGDWYVTKEATTEDCGEERRDCANCGEAETRVTEKLPSEDIPGDTGMSEAEKALRQSIADGFTDIAVTESIILSQDLHIPEAVSLVIENGATLTVPDGVILKSDGQMFIFENSALKTKGGTLEIGNQDWAVIDVWGGTLDVSEGTLLGMQQNFVRVLLGSTSSVRGIENHMLYGDYLVDSMGGLATALSQADQYGYMQMDVTDGFALNESLVIPENALLSILGNETEMTIPKGVTVTNKGQVWGLNASTLIVMNGAEFHNEGYLYMEEGSALLHFGGYQEGGQAEGLVFYGVISQSEMEEMLSEDSDQIIYLFETTLEQNMELSTPFVLYHCGKIVIPAGVTLTMNGPLSLMAGGQIIVESGGKLVVNGDVSNEGAVLVSDGGALEANGSWEGNQPLSDHTHAYSETVTNPTCTQQGYTTYTCGCGDSYVGDYVAAQGHSIGGWHSNETEHWHICSACGETLDAAGHDGTVCSVCGYETPGEDSHDYSLGDVNHDGKINAKDATLILQKSVGVLKDSAKFCEDCAEVSGDGKLNAKDSTLILQFSVGLRDTFPAQK